MLIFPFYAKIYTEEGENVMVNNRKIKENYKKRWTTKEDNILIEQWGIDDIDILQKKLQRTINAIYKRSKVLGLKSPMYENYFTKTNVSKILTIDLKTLNNMDIKFTKKKFKNRTFNVITQDKLLKWLEKNQDKFYAKNIPEYALGIEPNWLIEKRKNENKSYRQYKNWSSKEDYNLKSLYKAGICIEQIALELNRTTNSITKRLYTLRLREPKFKCIPWTIEEDKRLDYLINNTLCNLDEMADDIMRSKLSIKKRISRNYNSCLSKLRVQALKKGLCNNNLENQDDFFDYIKISK